MINYWTKDETRKEIITKTLIPNNRDFAFYATYFNLMDSKGLSLHFKEDSSLESEILFKKNGFEYFLLQHENFNELSILPNENLERLTGKIVSKINGCREEKDVMSLILSEM